MNEWPLRLQVTKGLAPWTGFTQGEITPVALGSGPISQMRKLRPGGGRCMPGPHSRQVGQARSQRACARSSVSTGSKRRASHSPCTSPRSGPLTEPTHLPPRRPSGPVVLWRERRELGGSRERAGTPHPSPAPHLGQPAPLCQLPRVSVSPWRGGWPRLPPARAAWGLGTLLVSQGGQGRAGGDTTHSVPGEAGTGRAQPAPRSCGCTCSGLGRQTRKTP